MSEKSESMYVKIFVGPHCLLGRLEENDFKDWERNSRHHILVHDIIGFGLMLHPAWINPDIMISIGEVEYHDARKGQ